MKHLKYPELSTYRKEWIPLLEQVKLEIESRRQTFVCYAIEDLVVPGQSNKELRALHHEIQMSLNGAKTVADWLFWDDKVYDLPRNTREYRLEWLDRIIERCKDE